LTKLKQPKSTSLCYGAKYMSENMGGVQEGRGGYDSESGA